MYITLLKREVSIAEEQRSYLTRLKYRPQHGGVKEKAELRTSSTTVQIIIILVVWFVKYVRYLELKFQQGQVAKKWQCVDDFQLWQAKNIRQKYMNFHWTPIFFSCVMHFLIIPNPEQGWWHRKFHSRTPEDHANSSFSIR